MFFKLLFVFVSIFVPGSYFFWRTSGGEGLPSFILEGLQGEKDLPVLFNLVPLRDPGRCVPFCSSNPQINVFVISL